MEVLDYSPCRCMTLRNLTTTLDEGLMSTWRFPRRSALTMLFKQSFYIKLNAFNPERMSIDLRGRIREPFWVLFYYFKDERRRRRRAIFWIVCIWQSFVAEFRLYSTRQASSGFTDILPNLRQHQSPQRRINMVYFRKSGIMDGVLIILFF